MGHRRVASLIRIVRRGGIAVFASIACLGAGAAEPEGAGQDAPPTLSLRLQQTAPVGNSGMSVTFTSYRDERCPKDVACIQAGTASARLRIKKSPSTAARTVTVTWPQPIGDTKGADVAFGHQFCFVSLEPRVAKDLSTRHSALVLRVTARPSGTPTKPCPASG
jgi:hypothetical protein